MFYQRKQVKRIKTTKFHSLILVYTVLVTRTAIRLDEVETCFSAFNCNASCYPGRGKDGNRLWDAACRYHGNGASYLNGISGREWGWLRGETSSLGRSRRKSWLHHLTSKALDNDRHKGRQTKQFLIFSFSFRPVQGFVFRAKIFSAFHFYLKSEQLLFRLFRCAGTFKRISIQ
jgi:hypothetical protein